MTELPYLTAEIPPVPGVLKRFYEDFRVDEVPLYQPAGHGDHVLFRIEKLGLSTHRAVGDIARALGVRPGDIGIAGLKDARAVTTQWLSIEHVEPERVRALELPRIRVLDVARHPRKLRTGHLQANRFVIRLRDTDLDRVTDVERVLETLSRRGVPNYFGEQRFGSRGDTGRIGRALIVGDHATAVSLIAGAPSDADADDVLRARELFEAGRYREAADTYPRGYDTAVRIARAMDRANGDVDRAIRALDRRSRRFYVHAFQSELFNRVLARRIDTLDRVFDGDLAVKHDTGGIFLVEDAAAEQPRAARFEISPTGPLFGQKMKLPEGVQTELEQEILDAEGIDVDVFPATGPDRVPGARRALRFPVADATVEPGNDEAGAFLEFRFTLPPGSYATALLREVCKDRLDGETAEE